MADPVKDATEQPVARPNAEDLLGLSPELVSSVSQALDDEHPFEITQLIAPLHCAEVADLIQLLSSERRERLIEYLRPRFDPEILTELEDAIRDDVAEQLGTAALARAIAKLESDDALLLISTLEEGKQRQVLHAIPEALRNMLEEGLSFPEDSAGRLMQRGFVAVPAFWTVGETIDFLRESDDLPDDFYDIFVVDPRHRAVGIVSLSHVLRSQRPVRISEIMKTEIVPIPATMDQEEVAWVVKQHDLVSAPVVDDSGRLIGVITIDDIVDVIHEEAEEDILRLGGVSGDDLYEAVLDTSKARFPWLFMNLFTAFLAAAVIGYFEATIEQIVFLAVLLPIVPLLGGNGGTQSLTVAVRAIAMKHLSRSNAGRVLSKELLVGALNGVVLAILVGLIAWLWSGSVGIGSVIAGAMLITLIFACFAGAAIPLILTRVGVDPAVASGVFLTTLVDLLGFFAFLGFATLFLL